ncbi:hypothetical protein J6590_007637 [Homalodisca vitripennis]|nr:hypothetical protein J6590_007637 [Homalodisca vitripennis]
MFRLKVSKSNAKHLEPMLKTKHAKTLRFIILAEPCSLTQETEIEEIGDFVEKSKSLKLTETDKLVSFTLKVHSQMYQFQKLSESLNNASKKTKH